MLKIIGQAREKKATDLHISSEGSYWFRCQGRLEKQGMCEPEDLVSFKKELERLANRQNLGAQGSFSLDHPEWGRLRVHLYQAMNKEHLAIRLLPEKIPSLPELGLPDLSRDFEKGKSGLVIICGATGSGKSTSLAGILQAWAEQEPVHIMTFEDPIEYIIPSKQALVHQCELGKDIGSYVEGLRSALRADPDIVMVGEIRDVETAKATLAMAETGHLVFTTMHASSATDAIQRLVSFFEPEARDQIRQQIANSLEMVLYQYLLPHVDSEGMVLASELLRTSPAIANQIRENNLHQIPGSIEGSTHLGMYTFEQSLSLLIKKGMISLKSAQDESKHKERLMYYVKS